MADDVEDDTNVETKVESATAQPQQQQPKGGLGSKLNALLNKMGLDFLTILLMIKFVE
jgi:hypothetical protein